MELARNLCPVVFSLAQQQIPQKAEVGDSRAWEPASLVPQIRRHGMLHWIKSEEESVYPLRFKHQ